jgi:hypothetical protein
LAVQAAGAWLATAAAAAVTARPPEAAAATTAPATCAATAGIRFELAAAILRASYEGFAAALPLAGATTPQQQEQRRQQLRQRVADLRRREYRFYIFQGPTREGERLQPGYVMPPASYSPDVEALMAALDDGGRQQQDVIIPPDVFDFAVWTLYKGLATELPPSQQVGGARSELNAATGRALARAIAGDLVDDLERQRRGSQAAAPFASVASALQTSLSRLAEGGYCCFWQTTYGDQPGAWPSDWPQSEPAVSGDAAQEAARTLERGTELPMQLRVSRPADVGASVALRNEEWGFAPRLVAGLFAALLEAGGYGALVSASVGGRRPDVVDAADVYFSQDTPMVKPSSLRDQLLLAFGDPMTEVVVTFTPETEVQDWAIVLARGGEDEKNGTGAAGRVVARRS